MGNWNSKGKEPVNIPKQKVNYNRPKDYFRPQSTICKVIYNEQSGTGAIYGYEFPEGTWRTLFITCNQVVRISETKEVVGIRLEFKDETIGNLEMTPDWVKWLWTSPRDKFNVTVIEFSPTALTVLSRMQYARLISAVPEKNTVTLYRYNGDNARGSIIDIIGDNIQYKIETEINLGCPLLNEDRDVVGIHAGSWESSNESAPAIYKAINIQSILEGFTKYVVKSLGGKSENELWFEKINQIPKEEFHFIGSGGYAKVYKITIQTELAVKIVRGVGKFSDYETQVRALEKEYGVVTSLDNHQRIIKFFGFVKDEKEIQLMIIMEYLEGGSLADKLEDQKPLPNYSVYKYFVQILEGVEFLHQRNIYHSDIKPANILITSDDNIKICDFGIAVGQDWQTKSSATTSHMKGDFHYMSPERLNNAPRSAANDIWSIGATFVEMISGKKINHQETFPQIVLNILQYKILINGMPYNEFLKTLSEDYFKREIISRTLCIESNRANCAELLSIVVQGKWQVYNLNPSFTICQVKYKEQSGNGAIYGCEYPKGTFRTLFITSFLKISNVNEITDVRLVFEDKTIGNQYLTPDWVKWLWTSPVDKFNVTVIEFSPTALKILSQTKYERLTSDVPVENEHVIVFQYIKESLNFKKGRINKVIGEVIEYSLDTEELSCCFPLLNEKLKVVGIHTNKFDGGGTLKAIAIGSILEAFKTFINEKLGGRTGNEMWLEKINLIPENKFELIGAGKYGQVYKIKIKAELTELSVAVKIVEGFGKLSDYEAQVIALEKLYAVVVTSLNNHPRIVQFFGIVRDISKVRIMIVMEYLEGGSLADRLKEQQPVYKYAVLKYLQQILEGVDFLHQRNIYHSDIKPANILITSDDNIKICDFGIAVGQDWQTKSSATTSHMKGDFHYMSPERLNNAPRSAANDIWSIGATFVEMISGKKINHQETFPQIVLNILQYKILINGMPYNEFLKTLSEDDYKKKIISRTLCIASNRANCAELLSIVVRENLIINPPLKLVRRLPKQTLIRAGEEDPYIYGMSYNSARDELFLADCKNEVVRAMRVRDNAGDLRDVYRAPHDTSPSIYSVCHMSDSDTLLVCLREKGSDGERANWLVALSRNGSEWREAQRVQTDGEGDTSCALSDSRVLIGGDIYRVGTTYMELFRVESGPRIARVHRIHVPECYYSFSATCGSDTLVAMSYPCFILNGDDSVRVHRLRGDRLEELARIQLKYLERLMWLADRLLVDDSNAFIELEVSDTRLERRRELIAKSENISVSRLCVVNDELAIFDYKDILLCSFA